ncbi:MAG: class I SAM-dependent methyltransferase [Solobacterium sp.]|nr:class I SAM-dependent methyltransferase [Solobacterium sp.]
MNGLLKEIHDDARIHSIPVIKDDGMAFLLDYIRNHEGIRDILEIGTAVGYSAISMASVRWDMTVDTVEVSPQMYEQACQNVREAGLEDRIHCHLCDGAVFETAKIYDLIFIDAAKSQYRRYLEHFMKNSREGTVFLFDNLAFHGIVDDNSLSHNRSTVQMVHKILKFREHLLQDERFRTEYYGDTGDGIAVAVRIK